MELRQQAYLRAMGIRIWERRTGASAPAHAPAVTHQPVAAHSASDDDHAARAAQIATLDWEPLAAQVAACTACGLHASRKKTVFGVGNRQADWLIVGEAPGAEEDRQGEPFVGRAGQLLNNMLRAVGLAREQVYIANILKCRPPNNRDPQAGEVSCCLPYLRRQIVLLQPKLILAVGRIAAQNLLACETPIGKLRGSVYQYEGVPLIVTYHPAYLLRSPQEKRKAWQDLLLAQRIARGEAA